MIVIIVVQPTIKKMTDAENVPNLKMKMLKNLENRKMKKNLKKTIKKNQRLIERHNNSSNYILTEHFINQITN